MKENQKANGLIVEVVSGTANLENERFFLRPMAMRLLHGMCACVASVQSRCHFMSSNLFIMGLESIFTGIPWLSLLVCRYKDFCKRVPE